MSVARGGSRKTLDPYLMKMVVENKDAKKAEAHNGFFSSVLNTNDRPWAIWSFDLEDHNCGNCDFPFVDMEILRGQLYQLNVPKSTGPWWG